MTTNNPIPPSQSNSQPFSFSDAGVVEFYQGPVIIDDNLTVQGNLTVDGTIDGGTVVYDDVTVSGTLTVEISGALIVDGSAALPVGTGIAASWQFENASLVQNNSGQTLPTPPATTTIQTAVPNAGVNNSIDLVAANDGYGFFSASSTGGSLSAPTATQANTVLAYFGARGHNGATWTEYVASISINSEQVFGTYNGSSIDFYTTPFNSSAVTTAAILAEGLQLCNNGSAPTGGDQGGGTLNTAGNIYVNGVEVLTSIGSYAELSATTIANFTVTNTSAEMFGMGATWTITPAKSGKILVTLQAYIDPATSSNSINYQLYAGAGTAPAKGAAVTGTSFGAALVAETTGGIPLPIVIVMILTGFTAGTKYWFDLAGYAGNAINTMNVEGITISLGEMP